MFKNKSMILYEIICCFFSGVYVGLVAIWNALGIKDALENALHQVIASGLGIPVIIVSAIALILPIGKYIIKKAFR